MKKEIQNFKAVILLLLLFNSIFLFGQDDRSTSKYITNNYPSGASYKQLDRIQSSESISVFRSQLKNYQFDEARHNYFGKSDYDGSLPDIICYIASNDSVYLGLSYKNCKNRQNANPVLWGKTKVYVLLLSDKRMYDTLICRTGLDTATLVNLKDSITRLATKRSTIYPWVTSATKESDGKSYSLKICSRFRKNSDKSIWVDSIFRTIKKSGELDYLSQDSKVITKIKSVSNSFKKSYYSTATTTIPSSEDSAQLAGQLIKLGLIKKIISIKSDSVDFNVVITSQDTNVLKDIRKKIKIPLQVLHSRHPNEYTIGPSTGDTTLPTTFQLSYRIPSFNMRREALQFQPEPGQYSLISIVNSAIAIFTGGKGTVAQNGTPSQLKDSSVSLGKIKTLIDKNGKDRMFASMVGFDIAPNSKTRIVIEPNRDTILNSITYTFGNYEQTRIYASLGVALNFPYPGDTKNTAAMRKRIDTTSSFTKFYIFAGCYLMRPQLPVNPLNISLIVGTNLSLANPLTDLVGGFSLGYGQFGGYVAEDFLLFPKDYVRKNVLSFGITYKFY